MANALYNYDSKSFNHPNTIAEYVTALEAAGGRVVVHAGALFLGGPDAPGNFWDVLGLWRPRMAHIDNLTAETMAFINERSSAA